jgi:hypothetical protein
MDPPPLMLLVGGCCALCAAIPCMMWAKARDRVEKLELELRLERENFVQASRTIQSLHKQFGLTQTTLMPLNVSQRLDGLWRKG